LANAQVTKFAKFSRATAALTFITVISGAFVAGLDAGLVYNEWPLMGGNIVPSDIFGLSDLKPKDGDQPIPIWKNFLENPTTVQFDHRMLAYTTLATVTSLWVASRRVPLPPAARRTVNLLAAVGWGQASLGIFTLLYLVPVPLASAHQAGAMTLWTAALYLVHTLRRLPVK
jgi:cytochrome c oxidase assembly protein subunit 15